jgi:hypothetical protein
MANKSKWGRRAAEVARCRQRVLVDVGGVTGGEVSRARESVDTGGRALSEVYLGIGQLRGVNFLMS